MLSNFVSGAPAIIEKMTEDLREFFRCLSAVIEEILRSIAGQCKNPDFDGQIAGLLKDLFELHLKVSQRHFVCRACVRVRVRAAEI